MKLSYYKSEPRDVTMWLSLTFMALSSGVALILPAISFSTSRYYLKKEGLSESGCLYGTSSDIPFDTAFHNHLYIGFFAQATLGVLFLALCIFMRIDRRYLLLPLVFLLFWFIQIALAWRLCNSAMES